MSTSAASPDGDIWSRSVQSYENYTKITPSGISQIETMTAYLGGSMFQTIGDNPVTAYRQLVQQYAKGADGKPVDPKIAVAEARAVFRKNPVGASLSGLVPRIIGVGLKRVPKFGSLLGIQFIGFGGGDVGLVAAAGASLISAPFINPIRMIEKQQRAYFKQTGAEKPVMEILRESYKQNFRPLFRGTVPLIGHSLASALLGLVGQPELQKYIQKEIGAHSSMGRATTNLISSALVSPIYVMVTNPLSRLEVIMQTSSIAGKRISIFEACGEMLADSTKFGIRGIFRGQGIGIAKAIISLTMFHEGRIFLTDVFKTRNERLGYVYEGKVKA
eukprot:gb/GEZN01008638.1/.p1 GENE.gb/GEZN01008638.1/~~gb/GEZN01008638.1/.p1  ORF type:complete len:331 (-),score=34.66 gb/GEZN01008638.1/:386-1378(-)